MNNTKPGQDPGNGNEERIVDPGRALLRAAVRAVALGLIPGGLFVGSLFEEVVSPWCEAGWKWLNNRKKKEQQQAIDGLARIPVEDARRIAEEELGGSKLTPEEREKVADYLAVIPMTARRAIQHTQDGGKPATLLSQLPAHQDSLMKFLPLRPPRFKAGHKVPSYDFELELLLGQGGFGEVWKARHIRRQSVPPRAFKFCLDESVRVSLERELDLLDHIEAKGRHPGIVQLLGTAMTAAPPFLMYEYIDGGDLVAWLASFDGRPPPARDVMRILWMTTEALGFAHELNIVHRDLKPANLLITRKGRIKIADFGIGALNAHAAAVGEASPAASQMSLLQGACTPMYADLAQQRGERVDARADVYALGVIVYQLLLGDVTQALSPYWREELEDRQIPGSVVDLVASCICSPKRRIPDANALLAEMQRLRKASRKGRTSAPTSPGPAQKNRQPAQTATLAPPMPGPQPPVSSMVPPLGPPVEATSPPKSARFSNSGPSTRELLLATFETDSDGKTGQPSSTALPPSFQQMIHRTIHRFDSVTPTSMSMVVDEESETSSGPSIGDTRWIPLSETARLGFVWVPGGTFQMGATGDDRHAEPDEKPPHMVRLTGFWLSRTPVTQEEWDAVMRGATVTQGWVFRKTSSLESPSAFRGPARPVENVSWNDLQVFLKRAPLSLRLPTEAEWEYAARGGLTAIRYDAVDEVAWYAGNSKRQTQPVGLLKPNQYGLYDMLGNVWEWCLDVYHVDAYKSRRGITDNPRVNSPSTGDRVLRGGAWYTPAPIIRASNRFADSPDRRSPNTGFRVVLRDRWDTV